MACMQRLVMVSTGAREASSAVTDSQQACNNTALKAMCSCADARARPLAQPDWALPPALRCTIEGVCSEQPKGGQSTPLNAAELCAVVLCAPWQPWMRRRRRRSGRRCAGPSWKPCSWATTGGRVRLTLSDKTAIVSTHAGMGLRLMQVKSTWPSRSGALLSSKVFAESRQSPMLYLFN